MFSWNGGESKICWNIFNSALQKIVVLERQYLRLMKMYFYLFLYLCLFPLEYVFTIMLYL